MNFAKGDLDGYFQYCLLDLRVAFAPWGMASILGYTGGDWFYTWCSFPRTNTVPNLSSDYSLYRESLFLRR